MTTKKDAPGRVPEWLVERLAAGDLPPARADELRRRLAAEPGGLERLARLADSDAEILSAHPPVTMAAAVRQRAAEADRRDAARAGSRTGGSLRMVGAPALALVAVTALIVWLRPVDEGTFEERLKGEPSLRVYRKLDRKTERLKDGANARPGDELQLSYMAGGRRYGAVLSLDGAGRVTFHLPSGGSTGQAPALNSRGEVLLPASYQLDAAPQFERFLLVASDKPFSLDRLPDVIRGTAPLPADTQIVWFTVRKEP
jgi:hypothetical protein